MFIERLTNRENLVFFLIVRLESIFVETLKIPFKLFKKSVDNLILEKHKIQNTMHMSAQYIDIIKMSSSPCFQDLNCSLQIINQFLKKCVTNF